MGDWQSVYKDEQEHRAEIVKAMLEDKDMKPVLLSKKDSSYQFGYFEVLVAHEHVILAIKLINEDIRFE